MLQILNLSFSKTCKSMFVFVHYRNSALIHSFKNFIRVPPMYEWLQIHMHTCMQHQFMRDRAGDLSTYRIN